MGQVEKELNYVKTFNSIHKIFYKLIPQALQGKVDARMWVVVVVVVVVRTSKDILIDCFQAAIAPHSSEESYICEKE